MNLINNLIMNCNIENLLDEIKRNKSIKLSDESIEYEIFPEELIVQEVPEDGYSVNCNKDIVLAISTKITDELLYEGMVRDLIRQVQNLRKDSGLKVEDRIKISIKGFDDLQNALKFHEPYFLNEVLGVKLDMQGDINSFDYNQSVKINGQKILIGISPVN